jgi:hypothetical protein
VPCTRRNKGGFTRARVVNFARGVPTWWPDLRPIKNVEEAKVYFKFYLQIG